MPITARLSHTLHRALGDDAASGLVDWMNAAESHRSELRELNELNFQRLDSRIDALEHKLDARIGELRHDVRADLAELRATLIKWSFVFWCGAFAAATLWRR